MFLLDTVYTLLHKHACQYTPEVHYNALPGVDTISGPKTRSLGRVRSTRLPQVTNGSQRRYSNPPLPSSFCKAFLSSRNACGIMQSETSTQNTSRNPRTLCILRNTENCNWWLRRKWLGMSSMPVSISVEGP